jgi:N-acetylated-alpha-linked acidic dipeptidase
VHLVNEVNTRVTPVWNTLAVVPGHITDEVVIVGNHRDAWVPGGADPNSGTASQYELVRGLGELIKKGWKPLRSIILASWDAEEYGLVGRPRAEDFGDWLQATRRRTSTSTRARWPEPARIGLAVASRAPPRRGGGD